MPTTQQRLLASPLPEVGGVMIASVVCVALARSIWLTSDDKHMNSKYDQSQRHERVEVNVETVCPFQPILNLVAQKQLVAHNPVLVKGQRKNEKGLHIHTCWK